MKACDGTLEDLFEGMQRSRPASAGAAPHSHPASEVWENMAEEYIERLRESSGYRAATESRIAWTCDVMRAHGALAEDGTVLDIGCGPGLFVRAYAQVAARAVGTDISRGMIAAAEEACADTANASFIQGDFAELTAGDLGAPYTLVTASITPALASGTRIGKMMELSSRWCANSLFVHWYDSLEERICIELFGREYGPSHGAHDRSFYALANLLWLRGYYPITDYCFTDADDDVFAGLSLAREYARIFSPIRAAADDDVERIYSFLRSVADGEGRIRRHSSYWYGMVLWDKTRQVPRRDYLAELREKEQA